MPKIKNRNEIYVIFIAVIFIVSFLLYNHTARTGKEADTDIPFNDIDMDPENIISSFDEADIYISEERTLFTAKWETDGKTDAEIMIFDKNAEERPVFMVPPQVSLAIIDYENICQVKLLNYIRIKECSIDGMKISLFDSEKHRFIVWGKHKDFLEEIIKNIIGGDDPNG